MNPRPVIALDGDGVLLDYNLAYAKAWERATGIRLIDSFHAGAAG